MGNDPTRLFYIPKRIRNRFAQVSSYPLTLVEAQSGAGKTTMVRDFLDAKRSTADIFTYAVIGVSPRSAWNAIWSLFESFDAPTARALKQIGIPTEQTLADLVAILQNCHCERETYIAIDNYQLLESDVPRKAINALAAHRNENLHIIVLTQDLGVPSSVHDPNILHIGKETLFFDRYDIDMYFRRAGVALSAAELDYLTSLTEGWIASLQLQLLTYQQTGSFADNADLTPLIQGAIWERLSEEGRRFLMALSLLDSFTVEQAKIMADVKKLPKNFSTLLETNSFIRFSAARKDYVLHSILRNFLRDEFFKESEEYQHDMWYRAGKAYAQREFYFQAIRCYYRIGAFKELLTLPYRGEELIGYSDAEVSDTIVAVFDNCPRELLLRYPRTLLIGAFRLLIVGNRKDMLRMCELMEEALAPENVAKLDIPEKEIRQYRGELTFMLAFTHFNDIEAMGKGFENAYNILQGPLTICPVKRLYRYAAPSLLYLYWRAPGKMQETVENAETYFPSYLSKLSEGFTLGSAEIVAAESLLLRGEIERAEVAAHRAAYLTSEGDPNDASACAADFILARIALLRGDHKLLEETFEDMKERVEQDREGGAQPADDMAQARIILTLRSPDIADWLQDIDVINSRLGWVTRNYGQTLHLNYLLVQKEYSKVVGYASALLSSGNLDQYVMLQIYLTIYEAMALEGLGQRDKATERLHVALDLAMPDGAYLPFAEQDATVIPLLKTIQATSYNEEIGTILNLHKKQHAGIKKIRNRYIQAPTLTQREKEVALLAQVGLSNREIGERLFISPNTVKVDMKRVFLKLGIKSRVQLKAIDL